MVTILKIIVVVNVGHLNKPQTLNIKSLNLPYEWYLKSCGLLRCYFLKQSYDLYLDGLFFFQQPWTSKQLL